MGIRHAAGHRANGKIAIQALVNTMGVSVAAAFAVVNRIDDFGNYTGTEYCPCHDGTYGAE